MVYRLRCFSHNYIEDDESIDYAKTTLPPLFSSTILSLKG